MNLSIEHNANEDTQIIRTKIVYDDIAQDKKLYELQRQKATELLELQTNNFVEKQKQTM